MALDAGSLHSALNSTLKSELDAALGAAPDAVSYTHLRAHET